jgi:hypothetical protein
MKVVLAFAPERRGVTIVRDRQSWGGRAPVRWRVGLLARAPPVAASHLFKVFVSCRWLMVLAMHHGVRGFEAMGLFCHLLTFPFGVFIYAATRYGYTEKI